MDDQATWSQLIVLGGLALLGLGVVAGVLVAVFKALGRDKLV